MIHHNIKQSVRGLRKNKLYSLLNLLGFAAAFALCTIIILFAYGEYTVNHNFPDYQNIYRLKKADKAETCMDKDIVPVLKNRFPEIAAVVPVAYINIGNVASLNIKSVSTKNTLLLKEFLSTNNDFFRFAGLKIICANSKQVFATKKSVVLSQSTALQLFGKTDVIDESITFIGKEFPISAVVEDMPQHATIGGQVFFNDAFEELGIQNTCTDGKCYAIRDIYLKLHDNTDVAAFAKKLNADFPTNKDKVQKVELQALTAIYFADKIGTNTDKHGNKTMLWTFISIAILTLIMSVFNYANFTISRQLANLKSAGIRLASGAQRHQIRQFYFVDVSISILISFVISLVVTWLALPMAAYLLKTTLSFVWLIRAEVLMIMVALIALVIVASSIVPMQFMSRLNIQTLFGKHLIKSGKHPVKQLMTVTQLTVSIALLAGLLIINKQLYFVKNADTGFDKENLLRIALPYPFQKAVTLKTSIAALPFVEQVSLGGHGAGGAGWSYSSINSGNGEEVRVRQVTIDNNFIATMGMRLLDGRKLQESDLKKGCYISETTFKQLGWKDINNKKYNKMPIVGVVSDITINSFHVDIEPMLFVYSDVFYDALNVRLQSGRLKDQLASLENTFKTVSPDDVFNVRFYDDYYQSLYEKEERQGKAITIFAIIAFIITCLGLLSQILQTTQNRTKEIGIRKINGATIQEVMLLLNKDFILTAIVAFVIATPIAYSAMNKWLENFAYKTTLSWWIFALAGIFAVFIALLTVSWQSWRAASRNPVDALRYE